MPNLSTTYQYVIDACNDPNIGYSQGYTERRSITLGVNYRTYCDCSSLMSKALTVGGYLKNNPWFGTGEERTYLRSAGWQQFPISGEWRPGDILWRSGHTEMVYSGGTGKGVTMGAHGVKGKEFPDQVSIRTSDSYASSWSELYRDPTQTVEAYKWHMSNSYLSEYGDDMTANAYMVYQYFRDLGFTDQSIAGLLGNMQQESTINPGLWENTPAQSGGYGLVQWTPASGWFNYASAHNIDTTDADESGDGQCACVNNCTNDGQWIPTGSYPYTWAEFAQLTDVHEAVKAFMYEYERPGIPALQNRLDFADHWYDVIINSDWTHGDPGDPALRPENVLRGAIAELQRRLVIPGWH